MFLPALFRVLPVFLLVSTAGAAVLPGSGSALPPQSESVPSRIVVGFVGGFVRHDSPNHGPVQLAQRIQLSAPQGTYVQVFENRRRKSAYRAVVRLLDTNHDGMLSAEERSRSRIVIFGHSWGAAAAVLLARDLRQAHIPVLLTVQVDSVAKPWQNDSLIPDNVSEAVNFYQPSGLIHGRKQITAADPAKTQILGNYLVDYRKTPVECHGTSVFDRYFTPSHAQSECDPRIWSQIEEMVLQRLAPEAEAVAKDRSLGASDNTAEPGAGASSLPLATKRYQ